MARRSGPYEREGDTGDGTLAAQGSDTPRQRPWAAGSGRPGGGGKKEVAVTPGPREQGHSGGPLPEQEMEEEEEEGQRTTAWGWGW